MLTTAGHADGPIHCVASRSTVSTMRSSSVRARARKFIASPNGIALGTIAQPGEAANDVDFDVVASGLAAARRDHRTV